MPMTATCDSYYCTCLGHLGQPDANRNDPISVALPKVAKASRVVTVAICCRQQFCFANFANVNDPKVYLHVQFQGAISH